MKKIIPLLAVLGGAAALAAYKMKKDEQKKIIDLDEEMLRDDEFEQEEEAYEEGPISEPCSCCMDGAKEAVQDIMDDADRFIKQTADKAEDLAKDTKQELKKTIKDVKEVFPNLVEEEIQNLKQTTKELMDNMLSQGDIHEHERPVQHTVRFESVEDAENFKNAVINRGFVVTTGETATELIVLHITPLDEVKLVANILYIANEARKHHGTYEGWTSKIAN